MVINLKLNVITQLELELADSHITDEYDIGTPNFILK